MAEFAFIMSEVGEGCDYTIGCGTRVILIEAGDVEEAEEHARAIVPDYFDGEERVPKRLLLTEVLKDIDPDSIKLGENEEDDPERAEYERLRKKFG